MCDKTTNLHIQCVEINEWFIYNIVKKLYLCSRMMNVYDILFLLATRCERSELSTHTHTHSK